MKKIRTKFRKRKIKKKSTSNSLDLAKVISEKIWQEASSVQGKKHIKLPLKFTFEDENPVVQEKEEWEKENEALFDEMEFALKAIGIGSFGPSMGETSDMVFSETEPEPKAIDLCHKGKHNLKLEEEIGMICINCSYVLEMKYIFPDFAKDPFRRWEKQNLSADAETNRSFVDRLKFLNCFSKGNSTSVNVEGTVWDLIPGMKEKMYPHQHEGFEFIWEHLAGGICLEKLSLSKSLANERNGCIINHAPGTGKTCLVIVFLLSFMRLHQKCRPVIVAPLSMLRNWEEEFHKWNVNIPFYNLNERLTKKESEKANRLFENVVLDNNCSRLLKLCFWRQEPSVLAISYQLFVLLTGEQGKSVIGEKNGKAENGFIRKILREFSDILVLDEGHTARNDNTKMWKALSEVKTKRKIILSGTLFQNNFTELYNTLCLANSKFADQMSSKFANQMNKSRGLRKRHMQACDLEKDEWLSLTNSIVWKGDDRSKLKQMNYPFVHVYKGAILLELPGIKDSRIDLRPTALQTKLFNKVKKVKKYLRRKSLMSLVSIHPSLVSDCDEFSEDERRNLEKHVSSPDAGVKTKFVFELIGLCEALRERVLIFCSYVKPLKLIMKQLKLQFNWLEGRELLQMDGSADQERRKSIISLMNDPNSNVRVLLASTKASNEGINLVGASRVVFLDVGFNPSVESQAISRAYRIGQKKVVYVYHLVTSGTLEVDNYHSQNLKENISKLVFSSKNSRGCCGASNGETVSPQAAVLEDKVLESMVQHVNLQNMFEQIYERPRTD
ncbi:hypothetical protein Leryth_001488 [Lithospermum erythrorhizon]|nr:hypothetical protein Leryth_001488 [Lithospermum erythrorhizon]